MIFFYQGFSDWLFNREAKKGSREGNYEIKISWWYPAHLWVFSPPGTVWDFDQHWLVETLAMAKETFAKSEGWIFHCIFKYFTISSSWETPFLDNCLYIDIYQSMSIFLQWKLAKCNITDKIRCRRSEWCTWWSELSSTRHLSTWSTKNTRKNPMWQKQGSPEDFKLKWCPSLKLYNANLKSNPVHKTQAII